MLAVIFKTCAGNVLVNFLYFKINLFLSEFKISANVVSGKHMIFEYEK